MNYRRSGNTVVLRLDRGDEIMESLKRLADECGIAGGSFYAIGALGEGEIGVFDPEKKEYSLARLKGDHEIDSLIGNISRMDGKSYVHAHIVVTDKDLKTTGGHLIKGTISLTCEIFVNVLDEPVERRYDPNVGINVFDL